MRLAICAIAAFLASFCLTLAQKPPAGAISQGTSNAGARRGNPQGYRGPQWLGPFTIGGKLGGTPADAIRVAIGRRDLPAGRAMCFRDPSTPAFLVLWRGTDDSSVIRGAMISEYRDCFGQPLREARSFHAWRTARGIGLGSDAALIRSAYGQPTRTRAAKEYWFDYTPGSDPVYERAVLKSLKDAWVLEYRPSLDSPDLRAADFGIERGKVAWIWLYDDE